MIEIQNTAEKKNFPGVCVFFFLISLMWNTVEKNLKLSESHEIKKKKKYYRKIQLNTVRKKLT